MQFVGVERLGEGRTSHLLVGPLDSHVGVLARLRIPSRGARWPCPAGVRALRQLRLFGNLLVLRSRSGIAVVVRTPLLLLLVRLLLPSHLRRRLSHLRVSTAHCSAPCYLEHPHYSSLSTRATPPRTLRPVHGMVRKNIIHPTNDEATPNG